MDNAELLISKGYKIIDGGKIIGIKGNPLKLHKGTSGYVQLNTGRGESQVTYLVHRLVAQVYVPNPYNLPEVNHDNGIKDCNWSWNLKWCTRPQNIQHGYRTGLITPSQLGKTGYSSNNGKIVQQWHPLGYFIREYGSTLEAERETGVNSGGIQDVCNGRATTAGGFKWKYLQQKQITHG